MKQAFLEYLLKNMSLSEKIGQLNISHKKSFADISFKNKNDFSNKGSETPRVPINRLLKIEEKKKFLIKPIIKKKYIPIPNISKE